MATPVRKSRSAWTWLLIIPAIALLVPSTYARDTPELFGFPFFYWYQCLWILLTGIITGIVYFVVRD